MQNNKSKPYGEILRMKYMNYRVAWCGYGYGGLMMKMRRSI